MASATQVRGGCCFVLLLLLPLPPGLLLPVLLPLPLEGAPEPAQELALWVVLELLPVGAAPPLCVIPLPLLVRASNGTSCDQGVAAGEQHEQGPGSLSVCGGISR